MQSRSRPQRIAARLCLAAVVAVGAGLTGCSDDIASGPSVLVSAGTDITGDIGGICASGDQCPCETDADCASGLCIRGPDGEKRCAKPCEGGCSPGWKCLEHKGGSESVYVCVPDLVPNCTPTAEVCDGVDNNCNGQTDESYCDDGNPCTDNVCDPARGSGESGCVTINWEVACEDGDLCTINDRCKDAKCHTGQPKPCEDQLYCTINGCDLAGECTITLRTGPCDDESACTAGDTCIDGLCAPGAALDCDDTNPCTDDACVPTAGCISTTNTAPCEDGDPCTPGDECKNGACIGAKPVNCDDSNPCTKDLCDATKVTDLANGCTHTDLVDVCDDGDPCTVGDICQAGKCGPGDGKTCDDNEPCTTDGCDESGKCLHAALPAGTTCDDGDACTTADTCPKKAVCTGKKTDCDDTNACTVDSCDSNTGTCHNDPIAGPGCEDGDPCTLSDACKLDGTGGASCVAGSLKLCDDAEPCTSDACNATTGACVFTAKSGANGAPAVCDDGDKCSQNDICKAGKCAPGAAVQCPPTQPCTIISCQPSTGTCTTKKQVDGLQCEDGEACTQADRCLGGTCTAGPLLDCDDANPCTDDACQKGQGTCTHTANTGSCDDGNPCTADDTCTNKQCQPGKGACACTKDADCAAKDDANPCNGALYCALADHTCQVNSSTIVACDISKDTACAKLQCALKTGVCEVTPAKDGATCEADGSLCTPADACKDAVCVQGPKLVCNDGNPCTIDACDPGGNGQPAKGCIHTSASNPCSDGDPCTVGDVCSHGACKPGTKGPNCNDGNPCTKDACDPQGAQSGTCTHAKLSGAACDDGNNCTTGDLCTQGACQATGDKPPCNDNNPCTIDVCAPKTGKCIAKAGSNGIACDDGNPCTAGDTCNKGVCKAGVQPGCVAPNACQLGACDQKTGKCAFSPTNEGGLCNDGDACSLLDTCKAGKCLPKDGQLCNDNDVCTNDICDNTTGKCVYTPGSEGAACDDGSKCTFAETCKNGACTPASTKNCKDNNDCTLDGCDAKTGECAPTLAKDGAACNDSSACTKNDTCQIGVCKGIPAVDCASTACYAATCDPLTAKCLTIPQNEKGPCDDGDPCSLVDACKNGKCGPQNSINPCDDDNACTVDSCAKDPKNGALGCTHVPGTDGIDCDDDDLCTFGDACVAGECKPQTTVTCDDKNVCTEDSCNQQTGQCLYKPLPNQPPTPCTDGNACTLSKAYLQATGKKADVCVAGQCVGQPINCNDNNSCTNDSCAPKTGCKHAPTAAKACNDGSACTTDDTCKNGACVGKGAKCVDGKQCTNDICDKAKGCLFPPRSGACDDGSTCTQNDACKGGACVGGKLLVCDDGKACTDDSCDAKTGCKNVADDTNKCSDGEPCTAPDFCEKGFCKAGNPVICKDAQVCTTDSCKPGKGCVYVDLGDQQCDDNNACTGPDACKNGKCLSTGAKDCNDANPCTTDVCQPQQGCTHLQNTGPCTDGDACTAPDVCQKGACVAGKPIACDDGSVCTTDSCNPGSSGKTGNGCVHTKLTGACDDNNPCTTGDVCGAGVCSGVGKTCDDGLACTKDSCSLTAGCTHDALSGTACDDGNPCTTGDVCQAGKCGSTGTDTCDDGNACTADLCAKTGCEHTDKTFGQPQTASESSSSKTLVSTTSKAGPGGLPVPQDAKPAVKVTNALPGWVNLPGAEWIWHEPELSDPTTSQTVWFQQDFDVPAGSETLSGTLSIAADNSFECWLNNKLVGATDKNSDAYGQVHELQLGPAMQVGKNRLICAVNSSGKASDTTKTNAAGVAFKVATGWYKKGESPACDDGNGCTGGDVCKDSACSAGLPKNCDDNNPCTADSCTIAAGCQHSAANANPCNDASICSTGDHCSAGKCVGSQTIACDDGNACTIDKCHALSGCYGEGTASGAACDDGDKCSTGSTCKTGVCGGAVAVSCDDGKPCTADSCASQTGCVHPPTSGQACDDGNTCTTLDACSGGVCVGKTAKNCDDGNVCTDDSCAAGDCTHKKSDTAPCDDGNACTDKDACKAGVCASGAPKSCFDTLQCTADACDSATGKCTFTPLGDGECDDGNLCTLNDRCEAGKCAPGTVAPCGDGNPCTTDSCAPVSGQCAHEGKADGVGCDDGNACTTTDRCSSHQCAGVAKSCDDNKPCTKDSCAPATGICGHDNEADGTACGAGGACKSGVCL